MLEYILRYFISQSLKLHMIMLEQKWLHSCWNELQYFISCSVFLQLFCLWNKYTCHIFVWHEYLPTKNTWFVWHLYGTGLYNTIMQTAQSDPQSVQTWMTLLLSGVREDKTGLGAPQGFQRLCLSTLGVSWGAFPSIPEVCLVLLILCACMVQLYSTYTLLFCVFWNTVLLK